MRQHARFHSVDLRAWLQGLFGAASWQTLGLDEPVGDLLTFPELVDEAVEELYGYRRRVCRAAGRAHSIIPIDGAESPAGDRRGPAGELRVGRSVGSRGTGPRSGGRPGPAE